MEHLNPETLARLVDEEPRPSESRHLRACDACAAELEALRSQTGALAALPDLRPPVGDWEVLEARLRSEGLLSEPSWGSRLSLAHTPAWMRAAAAAAIFVAGSATGLGLASRSPADGATPRAVPVADARTLDQAAAALANAEERYVDALSRYRELLGSDGSEELLGDPAARYAALEYLVAAGQAAVRQAPADPFLNGLLASTLAEREATLRRISTRRDNWF